MVEKKEHSVRKKNFVGITYAKTVVRAVKQNFTRFVAIFAIIALGVGFLCGLISATPDMKASINFYYNAENMTDIFIKSSMGITEEDIVTVTAMNGVEKVTAACVTDWIITIDRNENLVARIYGQNLLQPEGNSVNNLTLLEGRMPENSQECVVERSGSNIYDISLGTAISIAAENNDYENISDTLAVQQYTVVGVVSNPFYISNEREPANIGTGSLGAILYVDRSCYSLGVYTDLYLRISGSNSLSAFSDTYENYIKNYVSQLESVGKQRSLLRYNNLLSEATQKLQEAEIEYAENKTNAENELAKALGDLNAAKNKISDGKIQLAAAKEKLKNGENTLAENRAAFQEQSQTTQAKLDEGFFSVNSGFAQLASAKESLDSAAPEIQAAEEAQKTGATLDSETQERIQQYYASLAVYYENIATLNKRLEELNMSRAKLDTQKEAAKQFFAKAEAELTSARKKIAASESSIKDAEEKLAEGQKKYNVERAEADEEFANADKEIVDAKQKILDMDYPQWYVLDRNSNISFASFQRNVEKVAAITNVFPLFFILVAMLVTLTTMTRMVEEERTQIGILKALGYTKGAIFAKYIIYCGAAGLLGSTAGTLIGYRVLPLIIWNAYATLYHLPELVTPFNWTFTVISSLLVALTTVTATLSVCYYTLREKPAALMLPRAPKAGKRIFLERITPLWSRLSFSNKSTARNIVRYKKHFFMTVTGIAGCAALMLTGFGLKDSIGSLANTQFNNIFLYDLKIEISKGSSDDTALQEFLSDADKVQSYTEAATIEGSIKSSDTYDATIIVPEDISKFKGFINLVNRESRETIDASNSDVAMSEMLAKALDLHVGDIFVLNNPDGESATFTLDFISENYIGTYVYISKDTYTAAFAEKPENNTIFVKTYLKKIEEKGEALANIFKSASVSGAAFVSETKAIYDNLLYSMNYIIIIIIAAAGSLAVIVLYNLINVNIEERKRELATLKVLGYHREEIAAYIFREIAILSILGIIVGLGLGVVLHSYIIHSIEDVTLMFGRKICWLSFVYSGGITLLFSLVVDLFMTKKLRQIKMTDSLKAND